MSLASENPFPSSGKQTSRSLLVVADLETSTMLFDHLVNQNWQIDYVENNEAVLALLKQKPFDLILTSQASSAKEDLKLLRQIRAFRPHTRMIILTRESTPQDVIAALRERAFSYFSKPFSYQSLAEMIRMALDQPSWDDGIEVISATPAWIRLLVRCDLGVAERMVQFFLELADLPEEELNQVSYAFREMLMNAIRYGGRFDPDKYVEISYVKARNAVGCKVKDPGIGFSLDELYHAAVSNPLDSPLRHITYREAAGLPAGGYGILLTKHLVDELIYNEQGNEVLLIKYLNNEEPGEKQILQGPTMLL